MLQRILRVFRPKDKIFFKLFQQSAANLVRIADELHHLLTQKHSEEKRADLIRNIHELEHETDHITHTIFVELSRNFITPFDREDIYKLASALDDVADNIQGCAKRFNLYKIQQQDPYFKELSVLIREAVQYVTFLVTVFKHLKKTPDLENAIIQINVIENKGDDIFNESMQRLFEEDNLKTIIKKKEIYQILEATIDRCEDVANVIESIVLKYT